MQIDMPSNHMPSNHRATNHRFEMLSSIPTCGVAATAEEGSLAEHLPTTLPEEHLPIKFVTAVGIAMRIPEGVVVWRPCAKLELSLV